MNTNPMTRRADEQAPTLEEIEALAAEAFAHIPAVLARQVEGVVIRIEDFPDAETAEEMELESPFDLLGLYRGRPIGERSVSDPSPDIDLIFLYRRPLLDYWCESDETLGHLVRHVLIHEIGHHFGFSDEDMERLEAEADASAEAGTGSHH
ncbi:MAG: metallopeptidase family protein [Dongiaceae bacterium]|jgi:predicted Zn-dependent protease with MMP-like domain